MSPAIFSGTLGMLELILISPIVLLCLKPFFRLFMVQRVDEVIHVQLKGMAESYICMQDTDLGIAMHIS